MLALLGLLTIVILLVLIISKKTSAITAMIIVPILTGLLAGFGWNLAEFITEGIVSIAPTGVMFIFAILFFGVLMDAGTFNPIIQGILKLASNDPARVAVGSALLAMIVHLDGSGASTFLIAVPAFIPVYDRLNMKRSTLACIVALAAGTMNILPWGGPTIRAATALEVPVTDLFNPLLFPVLIGLVSVLLIAYFLGKGERASNNSKEHTQQSAPEKTGLERPRMFFPNILIIVMTITILVSGLLPPHVIFMIAFVLAISLNYPNTKMQAERINAHAKAVVLMVSILFAAGVLIGIMKGTGMIDAMATASIEILPNWMGSRLALITGIFSMPLSLLFDPDSYYFGILPILASTAEQFGGNAIEVGRASIIGQMTTGFAVSPLTGSTFLLIGLAGIDLGSHQRKTIPYAFLVTLIILISAVAIGTIHLG